MTLWVATGDVREYVQTIVYILYIQYVHFRGGAAIAAGSARLWHVLRRCHARALERKANVTIRVAHGTVLRRDVAA